MKAPGRCAAAAGTALLVVMMVTAPAAAQEAADRPSLALVGGAWEYDLSGTGTSWFAGARGSLPVGGPLVFEPGVTYARYGSQGGSDVNYLIPEAQLQIESLRGGARPFLGIGAGPALGWSNGDSQIDLSLSVGAGVRFDVSPDWGARAELRVRSIDPWTGTVAEWTAGVSRRLGR